MMSPFYKALLPNRALPLPILGGPFRGAVVQLNPRHSLRKVFGIYEHELNGWITTVLSKVDTVIDIGANDGYFTFGCAAALLRTGKPGEILAFEPEAHAFNQLELSLKLRPADRVNISLFDKFVGSNCGAEQTTLNALAQQRGDQKLPQNTLIKMDVEGAELDVIAEASLWLNPTNYFLIEVHEEPFLKVLTEVFLAHNLKLRQINQRPLPLLGHENRSRQNWWLVSEIP